MTATAKVDGSVEIMSELRALIASGGNMGSLDERKVRAVVDAMRESFEHINSISTNPYADPAQPYYASSIRYYRAKHLRDKRCLLTYLLWRQSKVSDAWWAAQDSHLQAQLAPAEATYLQEYDSVMVEYMNSFAVPIDLRAFTWRPPSSQQLEVRGLVDYVFVSPVTGSTISIYAGKQILLSFVEAESLIQQKVVDLV